MGVFRQFPYSNFHEMNMDEIIKIVKDMLEQWAEYYDTWDDWKTQVTNEWSEMQTFINTYFDNLDVQTEINNKIISMVNSGEFSQIVDPYVPPAVSAWLADHITQPVGVVIDTSLTVSGACADAKATGDAISNVKTEIDFLTESIMGEDYIDIVFNFPDTWEIGNINDTTGIDEGWSKAIRTKSAIPHFNINFDAILKSLGSGFYMYIFKYTDEACTDFVEQLSTILNYQGLTSVTLPTGFYYRFTIIFTDLRVITQADIDSVCDDFVISSTTQIIENEKALSEAIEVTNAFNFNDVFSDVTGLTWIFDKYVANYGPPTILDASDYAYTQITVHAGERYSVKGWSFFGQKVALYYVGTTLNTEYPTTSDNPATYHEFVIDIPTDGILYINKNSTHSIDELTIGIKTGTSLSTLKPEYIPDFSSKNIYGKKWEILGDSLSDETADSDTVYWTFIAENNAMDATQRAVSGCGFLQGSTPFSAQALNIANDAEIVTAFGSWNDLNMAIGMMSAFNNLGTLGDDGDENLTYTYVDGNGVTQTATNAPSLYGAVRLTIDTIITRAPSAKIGFILPTPWGTRCWFNATTWVRSVMDAYLKAITDTCAIYSIPVLDLYHNGQMKPWISSFQTQYYKLNDSTHPNTLGHEEFIAPPVEAWMENVMC